MLTTEEHQAAEDAAGQALSMRDIEVALQRWADTSIEDMQKALQTAKRVFDALGGRSTALADEIDALHITIAVRTLRTHG